MVANSTWWKSWRLVTEGAIASAADFSIRAEIHLLCLHPGFQQLADFFLYAQHIKRVFTILMWWRHRNWLSEWIDRAGEVFIKNINSLWVWMVSCSFGSQCACWCSLLTNCLLKLIGIRLSKSSFLAWYGEDEKLPIANSEHACNVLSEMDWSHV